MVMKMRHISSVGAVLAATAAIATAAPDKEAIIAKENDRRSVATPE